MVADAFVGLLTFKQIVRNKGGLAYGPGELTVPITADDVAGNKLTFPQTGETGYRPPFDCQLVDVSNAEDGNDTTRWEIYMNGMQTQYNIPLGITSGSNKPPLPAKPFFPANALIQIYQRA